MGSNPRRLISVCYMYVLCISGCCRSWWFGKVIQESGESGEKGGHRKSGWCVGIGKKVFRLLVFGLSQIFLN